MRAAIVLAAGGSARFGRANKLLQPLHGRPLLAWALAIAAAAPVRRVIVVTGSDRARVGAVVRRWGPPGARIAHAGQWRRGLAESLSQGVRALRPIDRSAFVFLGDMPDVPASLAGRLVRALGAGVEAVRVAHHGRPGHPVLVRTRFARAVAIDGDRGLGHAIGALRRDRRAEIEAGPSAVRDIDRRADFRRRVHMWRIREKKRAL